MSTRVPILGEKRSHPTSPFKGLAPFEDSELDEQLFFGREHERDVIVANVVAARLTVLYGPTGVGKSSVLRAGVARDLRALPEEPLVVVCDSWAESPAATLAAAVAGAASIEPAALAETIEIAAAEHREIYLLLDQVEEYFVYHGGDPALGDALAELVTRPELPVHILVAIREDVLARLDAFKRQLPALLANRLQLEHLSVDEGRRAILGPVERFAALAPDAKAVTVEPELVDAVLAGVTAEALIGSQRGRGSRKTARGRARIETPYLQLVMQRIWEVERDEGSAVLRRSTLDRLGGPARIVGEHLERALETLSPEQKVVAAQVFNHLVTPSGMKIAHGSRDLAGYTGVPEAELATVLTLLARARILRPVHGPGGEPAYEIFHDVLADAVLAWRVEFEARAAVARERAAARRRHRRLLIIVGIALLALAAMGATTIYALSQRDQAQKNEAIAQSAQSDAQTQADKANASATQAQQQTIKANAAKRETTKALQKARDETQRANSAADRAKRALKLAKLNELRANESAQAAASSEQKAQTATKQAQQAAEVAQDKTKEANKATAAAIAAKTKEEETSTTNASIAAAYQSQAALDSAPVDSLELAKKAAELDPDQALVESTLRRALLAARELRVLEVGDDPTKPAGASLQVAAVGEADTSSATFSPDGAVVLTAGDAGARLFHADTGALIGPLATGVVVDGASFSKDGQTIAIAEKGRVELWTTVTRTRRKALYQQGSRTHAPVLERRALPADLGREARQGVGRRDRQGRVAGAQAPRQYHRRGHQPGWQPLRAGCRHRDRDLRHRDQRARLPDTGATSSFAARASRPAGTWSRLPATTHVARLWNAQDGSLRCATLASDGPLTRVSFNHAGTSFLTLDTQGDTRIWDARTCQEATPLTGHRSQVTAADFSLDDQYVVTAGRDRSARIFSLPDGTEQAALLGHTDALQSVAFSPDGAKVITAGADGTARLWDARIDRPELRIGAHTSEADGVAIAPDGTTLASVGADGDLRLWNLETRQARSPIAAGVALDDVAFSPDGTLVAAAGADGLTRLWNVKSHALAGQFEQPGAVRAIAFSPGGKLLATAGSDNFARVFQLHGSPVPRLLAHSAAVNDVAFSPNGEDLATATADGNAVLWRVGAWQPTTTFTGHKAAVNSVAFSPDGKQLVTASLDHDARIWNVKTGATVRVLEGHAGSVSSAAFSSDGKWVVTAGPRAAGIWATVESDLDHHRLFFVSDEHQRITAAVFSPTEMLLASAALSGSIATYTCALCMGTPELLHLASQRIAQLRAR